MQRDRGKGPAGRAASCRDGGVNAFGWAGRLVWRPGARRRPWHLAAAGRPCLWPASLFQEERLRTWEQKARGELAPLSPKEGGARMESPQLRRKAGSESKLSPHLVFELKKTATAYLQPEGTQRGQGEPAWWFSNLVRPGTTREALVNPATQAQPRDVGQPVGAAAWAGVGWGGVGTVRGSP